MELNGSLRHFCFMESDFSSSVGLFSSLNNWKELSAEDGWREFLSCALDFHQRAWKQVKMKKCCLVYLGPFHLPPSPHNLPVCFLQCIPEQSYCSSVPSDVFHFTQVCVTTLLSFPCHQILSLFWALWLAQEHSIGIFGAPHSVSSTCLLVLSGSSNFCSSQILPCASVMFCSPSLPSSSLTLELGAAQDHYSPL